jgi:protein transport protein SEC13
VNNICWAPIKFGLCLTCGSSNDTIFVLTQKVYGTWEKAKIDLTHLVGVTPISSAPMIALGSLVGETAPLI